MNVRSYEEMNLRELQHLCSVRLEYLSKTDPEEFEQAEAYFNVFWNDYPSLIEWLIEQNRRFRL